VAWSHPAYEAVARLLGERTGLSFQESRHESAEMGIRRAMGRAPVTDLEQYRSHLQRDPEAFDDLVVELTVGETYFFREPGQFEFLRRQVLPEIRQRRGAEHVVRAWSAGCASGEEAYSLAILFEEEGLAGRYHMLATDISRAALAKARRADYGAWSLRGEGARAARPYLRRRGDRHVLDDRIRRRVTFEHLNLALDSFPSFATGVWGMDLILCRNVLIYFDAETGRGVARRLFEALAGGGWLITASSDPPLGEVAPFETVATSAGVFYRRGEGTGVNFRETAAAPPSFPSPPPLSPASPGAPEGGREARGAAEELPMPANLPRPQPAPAPLHAPPVEPGQANEAAAREGSAALNEARTAFSRGEYARAAVLTATAADVAAAALHVRALANLDPAGAERACAMAVARYPLSTDLHYLHAVLLVELGLDGPAAQAARRVIYLDRSLAMAHFTLGSILRRRGDRAGARRAYRNARDLCAARPPGEPVPLSDGEPAGRLVEAAAVQMAILEPAQEAAQ
jgi:chemotaxis protein methyltransferase CheR